MGADRVWFNGRIWTGRRFVARLVAEDGRVVAADDGGPGGPTVPTGAERTDLTGRLAVPAFLDAHLHLTDTALRPAGIDLRGAANFAEMGDRVRRAGASAPTGALWGGGWDHERLRERRTPTRHDLDAWVGDRPLVLTRVCEHMAVASSSALALLDVGPTTPDPPGGTIDREPDGNPTGLLRERALRLLHRFPYPTLRERPDLGAGLLRRMAILGLAGAATMRASRDEVDWIEALPDDPENPRPHLVAYGGIGEPDDIEAWGARRRRRPGVVQGIKLFADGAFGGRGAWLRAPYSDAPSEAGTPLLPPDQWTELVGRADAAGLRVAAHALGDRGVATVLEAIEAARLSFRPRIEHAGLVPPDLRDRLAGTNADVVVQPGFRTSDIWMPERIGPERLPYVYPLADLLATGRCIAGSSDAPIESLDPLDGIASAVAPGPVGQALSPESALALYTRGAASALELPTLGHLEPGAEASVVSVPGGTMIDLLREGAVPARRVWIRAVRVAPVAN